MVLLRTTFNKVVSSFPAVEDHPWPRQCLVWAPASKTGKSHSSFLEMHISLDISLLSDNDGDNNNESFSCDRLKKENIENGTGKL